MNGILKTVIIIGLLMMSVMGQEPFIVDSCDDGDPLSIRGGWWYTYDDKPGGGNSFVIPPMHAFKMSGPGYGEKGYAAHMKGTAGDKLGWDYIGMGVNLTEECGCPKATPVDMRHFSKIRFKMKGSASGGRLILLLTYTDNKCLAASNSPATLTEWADYEVPLTSKLKPDWVVVELDLRKEFHQPRWTKPALSVSIEKVLENLKNINFHFSSPDGDSIDLWVDDIEFVK